LSLGRDGLLLVSVSLFVVDWAEHVEAGVPAARVVEAFDVPEDPEARACSRVANRSRRMSSFSSEAKKLSATALSQGSPIDPINPGTVSGDLSVFAP
jgi:hypothetical protein